MGSFNTTKIKNAKEIPQEYAAISKSVAAILDQSPVSLS
jgi:penicillin amidase